jgi:excisionase family DNA binding protein
MKLWLNVAEGAEYAGVCRDLIYDACAARRMHHIRVGGGRAIRLKREWIDAWLERHAVVAQDGPSLMGAVADTGARTEGRP